MRKALLVFTLAFGLSCVWGEGEEAGASSEPAQTDSASPYSVHSSIDWKDRLLEIRVTLNLRKAGLRLPEGRLAAERMVARDLPGLAKDPFFAIPLDSRRNVGDSIVDGTVDASAILDLVHLLERKEASLSKDLGSYVSVWVLPLGAATALYLRGGSATPLVAPLSWKPTKEYSGIVIFADTELPVHGERGIVGRLEKGLFPRVYDSGMTPLIDRSTVDPRVLIAQGACGYAATLDSEAEGRIGENPLRIIATELFGKNRTDLVIAREDAERILALDANRRLVAEGKVLVVLGRHPGGGESAEAGR